MSSSTTGWRVHVELLAAQWARVRTYGKVVRLVLGECLRQFKYPIIVSVVLGMIGLGAQVGALTLIVYVVRHFEQKQPTEFHTRLFDLVLTADQFSIFMALISALLLLAIYVQYRAQRDMFRIMFDYEQYVCRRVFDIAARLPVPGMRAINSAAERPRLARLLVTVPRYSAGFVKRIVGAVVPALQTIVALIALIKLDVLTTLGVLMILAVSGVVLYWVNAHAIKLSHQQETVLGDLALERGEIIKALYQEPGKAPVNFGAHLRGTAYGRAGMTYYDSLLVIDQSRLVAGLGAAVVLGMVLAIKGREVLYGGGSIAQFLVYVMALHYFSSGCRNIAGSFTALNRFYPVISRHAQLLLAVMPPATPRAVEVMSLSVRERDSETVQRLSWQAGRRVALLLTRAASRDQLLPLVNGLHVPGGVARVGFVDYRLVELEHDLQPPRRATPSLPAGPAMMVVVPAMAEVDAPDAVTIYCGPLASFEPGALTGVDDVLLVGADGRLMRLEPHWVEENRRTVQVLLNEAKATSQSQAARGAAALALDEDLV